MGRVPRGYDGLKPTGREISRLLPEVLAKIGRVHRGNGEAVLHAWPLIAGEMADMTKAASFIEGILTVRVFNSSLYSQLVQYGKPKLMALLKEKFPRTTIKNIIFRMGERI